MHAQFAILPLYFSHVTLMYQPSATSTSRSLHVLVSHVSFVTILVHTLVWATWHIFWRVTTGTLKVDVLPRTHIQYEKSDARISLYTLSSSFSRYIRRVMNSILKKALCVLKITLKRTLWTRKRALWILKKALHSHSSSISPHLCICCSVFTML